MPSAALYVVEFTFEHGFESYSAYRLFNGLAGRGCPLLTLPWLLSRDRDFIVGNHLCGVIKGILVGLMLCVSAGAQQPQQVSKSGPVGRYQIIMHQGEMPRMNTFLLDTMTGKAWSMVSAPDGSTFWVPMDKVDNYEEELRICESTQRETTKNNRNKGRGLASSGLFRRSKFSLRVGQ